MNIVVADDNTSLITDFFEFNQIPYTTTDLWEQSDNGGKHCLPKAHENNILLILDYQRFFSICNQESSLNHLINFCKNNKIWCWVDADGLNWINRYHSTILKLDEYINSMNIKLFIDGRLSDHHPLTALSNIQIKTFTHNFFLQSLRIQNATVNKINCSRDFILTTVKKRFRSHRKTLWSQISAIDGLVDCGHTNYSTREGKKIGRQPHHHRWASGHPSMDLYNDAWLEIVPETLYQDGYFITEKTVKPIVTKTPFLVVSTRYYLKYLREKGFQTFGDIIDETYDQQHRVEDRIRLMLEQLQYIIQNGSEAFYKECNSILEYNQNRLFEISGRNRYEMDLFIFKNLENDLIK